MTTALESAFEAALAAAEGEAPVATGAEAEATQPVVEAQPDASEQAPVEPTEQAEVAGNDDGDGSLFGDDFLNETPATSTVADDALITIDGVDNPVSVSDLKQFYRDGGMRQEDYTRKTQELSRQRDGLKEAAEFWEAFEHDAVGTIKTLAVRAGLISGEDAGSLKASPIYTQADLDAAVERELASRLEVHPDVVAAKQVAAKSRVDQAFASIEAEFGVSLQPKDREAVLKTAKSRGTTDIAATFALMFAQQQRKRGATETVAPPTKPTTTVEVGDEGSGDPLTDAWNKAMETTGFSFS